MGDPLNLVHPINSPSRSHSRVGEWVRRMGAGGNGRGRNGGGGREHAIGSKNIGGITEGQRVAPTSVSEVAAVSPHFRERGLETPPALTKTPRTTPRFLEVVQRKPRFWVSPVFSGPWALHRTRQQFSQAHAFFLRLVLIYHPLPAHVFRPPFIYFRGS